MKSLNRIKKELIEKAKKKWWIWENFWDNELRKFLDEYQKTYNINFSYVNPAMLANKHKKTYQDIVNFRNWCMTFDLSQLK